jgi:hypothetical protein
VPAQHIFFVNVPSILHDTPDKLSSAHSGFKNLACNPTFLVAKEPIPNSRTIGNPHSRLIKPWIKELDLAGRGTDFD